MRTKIVGSLAPLSMLLFVASASADPVVQVWTCEVDDGHTMDEVVALSGTWAQVAECSGSGLWQSVEMK